MNVSILPKFGKLPYEVHVTLLPVACASSPTSGTCKK